MVSSNGTSLILVVSPITGEVYYEVPQENGNLINRVLDASGNIYLPLNITEVILSDCHNTTKVIIG